MTCDFCCKCHACICRQGVVELKRPLNIGLHCFDSNFVWTDCWEDMHLNSTNQITITAINVDTPVVAGAGVAAVKSFCFINPLKGLECIETPSRKHVHTRAYILSLDPQKGSLLLQRSGWRAHIPKCNASLIFANHKEPPCKSPVDKLKDCKMLAPSSLLSLSSVHLHHRQSFVSYTLRFKVMGATYTKTFQTNWFTWPYFTCHLFLRRNRIYVSAK